MPYDWGAAAKQLGGLLPPAGQCQQVLRDLPAGGHQHTELPYDRVCFATGAHPRMPASVDAAAASCVVTVRDTDSVQWLSHRMRGARRVVVVGNGGIALELMCVAHYMKRAT
jgi:NADPH-dependent 2,4-dienoyl-CoA reductase/sulfur reductase-like enzyme